MVINKDGYDYKIVLKGQDTWMDRFLQSNLDIINHEAIPNKWDCVFILFGREGCSKTTLGTQCCTYLDKDFGIDHTVFTPDQFINAIENAKPESSILWDEAITGANVSSHATKISVLIISQLTQIRKKKLKIFLCFPYLNLLNKYFILRCIGGVYIYAKSFTKRGFAKFYDHKNLAYLYGLMKEKYRYYPNAAINSVGCNFDFQFSKCFCLDENDYDLKKETSRKDFLNGESETPENKVSAKNVECHHPPFEIRFAKTKHLWTCRRCGRVWDHSPFGATESNKNVLPLSGEVVEVENENNT